MFEQLLSVFPLTLSFYAPAWGHWSSLRLEHTNTNSCAGWTVHFRGKVYPGDQMAEAGLTAVFGEEGLRMESLEMATGQLERLWFDVVNPRNPFSHWQVQKQLDMLSESLINLVDYQQVLMQRAHRDVFAALAGDGSFREPLAEDAWERYYKAKYPKKELTLTEMSE